MVLESYQAIYLLKIDGPGIIPGNILTYERGSSIKKEERLIRTKEECATRHAVCTCSDRSAMMSSGRTINI